MPVNTNIRFAKFAVIGDPVSHSLSPIMHNAAFKALGIDARYEAVQLKTDELANFANKARGTYDGFNITVPHKHSIIAYLDEISDTAKLAESVNTVFNDGSKLIGFTTDGIGLQRALEDEFGISIADKKILFLGCGGACRAVAIHFASAGAKAIFLLNRTLSKAAEISELITNHFSSVHTDFDNIDNKKSIERFVTESHIIIQSTSLGLKDNDPSPLPEQFFYQEKYYYDMIYKDTAFLRNAKRKNCPCADGLSMLVFQGAESFKIWTGVYPSIGVMKEAVCNAIKERS